MSTGTEMIKLNSEFGHLVGSVSSSLNVASIHSLNIHSYHQYRKGYGTALYERFLNAAKEINIISIEIFKHNDRAIKFWESKGFKYVGLLDQDYLEYVLEK